MLALSRTFVKKQQFGSVDFCYIQTDKTQLDAHV